MRIQFSISVNLDLETLIETEDIGYDEMGYAYLQIDDKGCPVWETCWSGFTYTRLLSDAGKDTFEYKGAQRGFRMQNLLPEPLQAPPIENEDILAALNEGIEVIEVEGSYGLFKGPDALTRYVTTKEDWENKCLPVFEAQESPDWNNFGRDCVKKYKNRPKPTLKTGKKGACWVMA